MIVSTDTRAPSPRPVRATWVAVLCALPFGLVYCDRPSPPTADEEEAATETEAVESADETFDGDLAEILQVEDLLHCSFHPLRNLARMTMPEERFHSQFGEDFCTDLIKTEDGRLAVQEALDRMFPAMPAFFGRSGSVNNEIYRKWGIKMRTNDEMRDDYMTRVRELVELRLGLRLPAVAG